MKEYDLHQLLHNNAMREMRIDEFLTKNIIKKQPLDREEIMGHILKSEHNLRFITENIKIGFLDWATAGCYYASYHAATALILTKGYSSKNHLATLCILIQEFYHKELNQEDFELLSHLLDYQDLLFYVESKNKREDATYSTTLKFDKKEVEQLKVKAALFIRKIREIINI